MSFLFDWFRNKSKSGIPKDRVSIYSYVMSHVTKDGLSPGGETLPDEDIVSGSSSVRWMAGARDGAWGHHGSGQQSEEVARELCDMICFYCKSPRSGNLRKIYDCMVKHRALDYVDKLLAMLFQNKPDTDRLHQMAHALVTESPDREPVKAGLSIMGIIKNPYKREIYMTMGKHDEFTLYCAVAIMRVSPQPENDLWELARQVHGWGRIHCVERLATTKNSQIKAWLLREGYKNTIMNEYTAYTCAVTGCLREVLASETVDDDLLSAAGEIIEALLNGGPAQDMDDYVDGPVVLENYLERFATKAATIRDFLRAHDIKVWLENEKADWQKRAQKGWAEDLRKRLLDSTRAIINRPVWKSLVSEQLQSDNYETFFVADRAARKLGVDTWEYHWERLRKSPDNDQLWAFVDRANTKDRMADAVLLAERQLPLDLIASGPADEMGFGEAFKPHRCLDWILQALENHPGIGGKLTLTGIRSPVVRNRNMALRALSRWERTQWPNGTDALLREALQNEPDETTRETIKKVLDGTPLEERRVDVSE